MDLRAWIGVLLVVISLGGGYLRVRALRRAGIVHGFGHPVLDNLLLLASGLLLAAVLALMLYLFGGNHLHPIRERMLAYSVLILVGGVLTWLCTRVLRGNAKR
jgi:divalent metal cation (Fe/Co/Zn/Cd) transporter